MHTTRIEMNFEFLKCEQSQKALPKMDTIASETKTSRKIFHDLSSLKLKIFFVCSFGFYSHSAHLCRRYSVCVAYKRHLMMQYWFLSVVNCLHIFFHLSFSQFLCSSSHFSMQRDSRDFSFFWMGLQEF